MIFLITGNSGSGKTTLLNELAALFENAGIITGGFTAPGKWIDGQRSGFILHDIQNNRDYPLAETGVEGPEKHGRFVFNENTLMAGNLLLKQQAGDPMTGFIIVDEVGPFELRNRGWALSLDILSRSEKPQLWAVRPALADQVCEQWKFKPAVTFSAVQDNADQIFLKITEFYLLPQR